MISRLCFQGALLCGLVFYLGCASIVPPTGGPKDETPPKLLSTVPADSQYFLRPARLELYFDEYLDLRDARNQIQISPLLEQPLSASLVGKRVLVTLPDSLLSEETTYRIQFGEAIRDLNEGNVMEPYVYTFSTGGHFDSLILEGRVLEAHTGLPDTSAQILLVPADQPDSLWLKVRPRYVSRVKAGKFRFDGLPKKPFRAFALKDGNGNLLYDAEGEAVGFLDSLYYPAGAGETSLEIRLFLEAPPESKKTDRKGKQQGKRGSLAKEESRSLPPFQYTPQVDTSDLNRRSFDITEPLRILFSRPLSALETSKIRLYRDSLDSMIGVDYRSFIDTSDSTQVVLVADWKEDQVYTLGFQAGFAVDSGQQEAPAGRYRFRTKRASDYGILRLALPKSLQDGSYLIRLDKEADSFRMVALDREEWTWSYLEPTTYRFFLIEDRNGNGRWDSGDFAERRQPERVFPLGEPIDLKAGWELQFDHDEESLDFLFPNAAPNSAETESDAEPLGGTHEDAE